MEERKGLIQTVSNELKKINSNYSLSFKVIPISTLVNKKLILPELTPDDRNRFKKVITSVNEKRYELYLDQKHGVKKKVKSGTKETLTKYCNQILEAILQYEEGNVRDLYKLLLIDIDSIHGF
jgi:hypothetical protein